jgi:hypothetical protein
MAKQTVKLTGKQTVELDVTADDLGRALFAVIMQRMGVGEEFDDAGCDWLTRDGCTYIGGEDWQVSSTPEIAALVDAANILHYGHKLVLTPQTPTNDAPGSAHECSACHGDGCEQCVFTGVM